MSAIKDAMQGYFLRLVENWKAFNNTLPKAPRDENAKSFIYCGQPDEADWVCWLPVETTTIQKFEEIETVLGQALTQSIKDYFNSFWFCSLGGKFRTFHIQLEPVLPGIELAEFVRKLVGYRRAHEGKTDRIPIGIEKNGLLVVVDCRDDTVWLEDYEGQKFESLATDLEQLISGLE